MFEGQLRETSVAVITREQADFPSRDDAGMVTAAEATESARYITATATELSYGNGADQRNGAWPGNRAEQGLRASQPLQRMKGKGCAALICDACYG